MSYGSTQYRRSEGGAVAPRELEASAFVFVNRLLSQPDPDSRMNGLVKNHQLWSMLVKDVGSSMNALPPVLKKDLATIGLWTIHYSIASMGQPRSVEPLVQVNEDMIAALRAPPL